MSNDRDAELLSSLLREAPANEVLFSSGSLVYFKEKAKYFLEELSNRNVRFLESATLVLLGTSTSNETTCWFLLATGVISIALEATRFILVKNKLRYPTLNTVKWSQLFLILIRSSKPDATFLFETEVGATREIINHIQFAADLLTLVNEDDASPWKTLDLDGSLGRNFVRCLEGSTITPRLVSARQIWKAQAAYLNEGIKEVSVLRRSLSKSGPIGKELSDTLLKIRSAATFRKTASESITGRTLSLLLLPGLSAKSAYYLKALTDVSTNPYNDLHAKMLGSLRHLESFISAAKVLQAILESEYTELHMSEDFGADAVITERVAIDYTGKFILDAYDRQNHLIYVLNFLDDYNDTMIMAPTKEPKNWEEVMALFNDSSERLEDLYEKIDWALLPWGNSQVRDNGASNSE